MSEEFPPGQQLYAPMRDPAPVVAATIDRCPFNLQPCRYADCWRDGDGGRFHEYCRLIHGMHANLIGTNVEVPDYISMK